MRTRLYNDEIISMVVTDTVMMMMMKSYCIPGYGQMAPSNCGYY